MKTKFALLSVLLILSSVLGVSALYSAEPTNSATTTLNIKLNPIQTITVNPDADHKKVELIYTTEDDYNEGVTEVRTKHLKVFSTGGFQVKVESGEFLSNGTTNIKASDITVLATPSVVGKGENTTASAVSLGTTKKTLITSGIGGRNLEYDITYDNTGIEEDAYINLYKANVDNTFTTTVTYTIAAN